MSKSQLGDVYIDGVPQVVIAEPSGDEWEVLHVTVGTRHARLEMEVDQECCWVE